MLYFSCSARHNIIFKIALLISDNYLLCHAHIVSAIYALWKCVGIETHGKVFLTIATIIDWYAMYTLYMAIDHLVGTFVSRRLKFQPSRNGTTKWQFIREYKLPHSICTMDVFLSSNFRSFECQQINVLWNGNIFIESTWAHTPQLKRIFNILFEYQRFS